MSITFSATHAKTVVTIGNQYVSASCYCLVEAKYETFERRNDGALRPLRKQLSFTFGIQGRNLSIEVDLTPEHPAWKELEDVGVYDLVWLHVGEDGKVIGIRKNDPSDDCKN
jgi:hypothetical protein